MFLYTSLIQVAEVTPLSFEGFIFYLFYFNPGLTIDLHSSINDMQYQPRKLSSLCVASQHQASQR